MSYSDSRVLRRIFGIKRDEVTGEWRKLHTVLLTKYCSCDQIENKMDGECSTYSGEESCIQGFDGET
jgi:hypothetical protein